MRPTMSTVVFSCLASMILVHATACKSGDDDDTTGETAGETAAPTTTAGENPGEGVTECGKLGDDVVKCQAGQYCADPVLVLCENGCLNNDNCAADQTCVKEPSEDVGTCQNNGGAGPTEAEFCKKVLVCDPSGTMEMCAMIYAGTVETCHQCFIDSNCGDINSGSCNTLCGG